MNDIVASIRVKRERPIGIDLFAGVGGMSLGFEQAGFDVAAAVEIDPVHAAAHEFNFPRTAVLSKSVVGLSAKEIRKAAGIGTSEIDCVFGGAPCQGFSLIGQRILDDSRNLLVREFVRIVTELKARSFVFENVKGLTLGKQRAFLDELVQAFDGAGYKVLLPWKVLNAAHYGAPQFRERLILIGVRKGELLPDYPTKQNAIAGREARNGTAELPVGPCCAEALSDLPDAESFSTLKDSDFVPTKRYGKPSPYAAEMRCLSNDAWHYGYVRDWNPGALTSSARTEHTQISRRRFSTTEQGQAEEISRFFKLPSGGVSNTLRAGTDGARGAFTSPRPIHYKYARCVTVREMARLHGFPDWFRMNATKWHGARQIGNAVPPPLARAIATELLKALNFKPVQPNEVLKLGNSSLLKFDMASAAKYFGVEPLSSRRDRKSGAKKRKQADIERERQAMGQIDA